MSLPLPPPPLGPRVRARPPTLCLCAVLLALVYLGAGVGVSATAQDSQNAGPLSGQPCTTPNKQEGHCVRLTTCRPLLDLLHAGRRGVARSGAGAGGGAGEQPPARPTLDPAVTQLLRGSHCGFQGSTVMVCCPLESAWHGTSRAKPEHSPPRVHPDAYEPPTTSAPRRPALGHPPDSAGGSTSKQGQGQGQSQAQGQGFGGTGFPSGFPAEYQSRPQEPAFEAGYEEDSEDRAIILPEPQGPRPSSSASASASPSSSSSQDSQPDDAPAVAVPAAPAPAYTSTTPPPRAVDLPAENLALLPTEMCGLFVHPQDDRDRTDNRTADRAAPLQYPWMARLGYPFTDGSFEFLCSGSLISERYVLTAAHCVSGATVRSPTVVRFGEYEADLRPQQRSGAGQAGTQDFYIEETLAHEDYRSGLNDIALVRLTKPVTFSDAVVPICLPIPVKNSVEWDPTGQSLTVAGWGKTSPYKRFNAPSRWLHHAQVHVMDPAACRSSYDGVEDMRFQDEQQLCVGGPGQRACQGDSGSPLMHTVPGDDPISSRLLTFEHRVVQYGVLSSGLPECAVRGAPVLYTRVSHFLPWIVAHLRPAPYVPKDVDSGTRSIDPRFSGGYGYGHGAAKTRTSSNAKRPQAGRR